MTYEEALDILREVKHEPVGYQQAMKKKIVEAYVRFVSDERTDRKSYSEETTGLVLFPEMIWDFVEVQAKRMSGK